MNDLLTTLCSKDKPVTPAIGRPRRNAADRAEMRAMGLRLRWVRDFYGLTQSAVAAAVGISQQAWAAYETGTRLPDQFEAVRLAGRLGITIDYLRDGDITKLARELAIHLVARHPELAGLPDTDAHKDRRQA